MSDQEQRLRKIEIEVATIKPSLESISSRVQTNNIEITKIKEEIKKNNQIMSKWDGGIN